jgi:hypothetical protein
MNRGVQAAKYITMAGASRSLLVEFCLISITNTINAILSIFSLLHPPVKGKFLALYYIPIYVFLKIQHKRRCEARPNQHCNTF